MTDAEYYNTEGLYRAERYEQQAERDRFARILSMVPREARSLLDVGAGNGAFLAEVERTAPGLELGGLERSPAAIGASVCRTPLREGSAEALPYADRSYDVVTSLEVIEHLPYGVYETALRELQRVSARWLLVSVPFREPRHQANCPYCGCEFHPFYHMRRFDERVMRELFTGFDLVREEKVYAPGEYALIGPLRRVYRRFVDPVAVFPPLALCPQCGFTRRDGAKAAASNGSGAANGSGGSAPPLRGAWRAARRFLPRRNEPRWIVGLYQRRDG